MTLPDGVDPDLPLPYQVKQWVAEHGSEINRALLKEIELKADELLRVRRQLNDARNQLSRVSGRDYAAGA
jgi:arsenate reductase-like glutaredoxin family protein